MESTTDSGPVAAPDFKRPVIFGLTIALFAGVFWGSFYMSTGDAIMWAAIFVGMLVGGTLRISARGLYGARLQLLTIALICIAFLLAAYIRYFALYLDFVRDRGGDRAADMVPASLLLKPSFIQAFARSLTILTRQDAGWLMAGSLVGAMCVRRTK